ncbi:MAG: CoA transferase, partial [bacterium]|nr:CoA transferase [bacterium]
DILKGRAKEKTTAEWLSLFTGEVPCAPVNTVEEAFSDPQVAEDEMVIDLPHPEFGAVRVVASPIKISDARVVHRRGPALGEHTDLVLSECLGMSQEKIDTYRTQGVF